MTRTILHAKRGDRLVFMGCVVEVQHSVVPMDEYAIQPNPAQDVGVLLEDLTGEENPYFADDDIDTRQDAIMNGFIDLSKVCPSKVTMRTASSRVLQPGPQSQPLIEMSTPIKTSPVVDLTLDDSPADVRTKSALTAPALKGYFPKRVNTHIPLMSATSNGDPHRLSSHPPSPVTRRLQHSVTFASDRVSVSPIAFENDSFKRRDHSKIENLEPNFRQGV